MSQPDDASPLAIAEEQHRLGMQASDAGTPAVAVDHLIAGLAALGWTVTDDCRVVRPAAADPAHDAVAARLLISLAYSEGERGYPARALELLEIAAPVMVPEEEGSWLQQKGCVLLRAGELNAALASFDRAEAVLSALDDLAKLTRVLSNRSAVRLQLGQVRASRADAHRAAELAAGASLDTTRGMAIHNAAYCDVLTGDLPAALTGFRAAERLYEKHGRDQLPVLATDQADGLLMAGLAAEAGAILEAAIEQLDRHQRRYPQAEAELLRAQAALMEADHTTAAQWAERSERHFDEAGNRRWALLAALTGLRAEFPDTGSLARFATRARRLADRLDEAGLKADAEAAWLLRARALVRAGRSDTAQKGMPTPVRSGATLDTVLLRRLTRAEIARANGRHRAALSDLRRGLAALHERRGTLGSPDLQAAVTGLGRELASTGLRLAFDRGSPRTVFAWTERVRAQAFRIPPVRPPADPELADMLAELRHVRQQMRTAELEGRSAPEAVARCKELERRLIEQRWQTRGPGLTTPEVDLRQVQAELGDTGQVLLSFFNRQGRIHAVYIDGERVRLVGLGALEVVEEATRRLLADLDAMAGRTVPARLEAVLTGSARRQLRTIAAELLGPLRADVGDRDLVLVPTRSLAALPWGLLPDLHGRPVVVSASASVWWARRAARRRQAGTSESGVPLLVAGPGVPDAPEEVRAIAPCHQGAAVLTGHDASVTSTVKALSGATVAHIAAHGHHEPENPLFSRLDLADGPLMAYDIPDLAEPARHVVLSACDVGRATVRPGDEMLGFTAALLRSGTSSVISSVARVGHDTAVRAMTTYHHQLAAGVTPARALADATEQVPFAPFVCFGIG